MKRENYLNFTEKALNALPNPESGASDVIYHDTGCPALCLRVSNGGTKTYFLYKKYNGQPLKITIGRLGDIKLYDARKQAEDMRHMAAHGQKPTNKRQMDLRDITLKDFFEKHYRSLYSDVFKKENSRLSDQRIFKNCLGGLGNKKLLSITKFDVELLHKELKQNIGLHTANRMLALVRHMYNMAIDWAVVPHTTQNPAAGIKKFPEKSRDRFMNGDEIRRFFAALSSETNEIFRDYVLLSLFLGQRRNNILALRWADIDFDNGFVYFADTKNNEPLKVPLTTQALALLQDMQRRKTSDWLLPSPTSASGHYEEPKKSWKALLARAGIENLRLHDLRRTLGSYQAIAGSSLHIIGQSLGHKSSAATQVYARLSIDPVRDSIQRATDRIMEFTSENDLARPLKTD